MTITGADANLHTLFYNQLWSWTQLNAKDGTRYVKSFCVVQY